MLKYCGHYKTSKRISEFGFRSDVPDKHQYWCRDCMIADRKRTHSANPNRDIEVSRRYSSAHAEQIASSGRRYRQTHPTYSHDYWQEHHKQRLMRQPAHDAVYPATKSGKLTRPDSCEICHNKKRVFAHHHLGYEPEHHLSVQWVCQSCHLRLHRSGDALCRVGSTTNLGLDASPAP